MKKGRPKANHSRDPVTGEKLRIYELWNAMHKRCYSPKHRCYERYGGRGITVCEEWHGKDGFIRFKEWGYANGFYENPNPQNRAKSAPLDRIDSDKPYCPSNCRWITLGENADKARRERALRILSKNKI